MVGHKERTEVSKHVVKVKMDSVVDENTAINLGGENVECRIANIGWSPYSHTLIFHESKAKHVLTCLQRHINSLPRHSPRVQIEIDTIPKNSTAHSSFIKNVKDTYIKTRNWDTSQIEEYLKCHEFHESLQISFKLTGQGLNSDSKLTNVKGLTLYQSGEMTPDILEHFSGQYLVLFNYPIQQEPWRNLIFKWKRGEA
ncbi:hypothetical protein GCK72_004210 [Caenorhabditis remanei]|uniref:DUF38 domain-containing protein n=1 Tax=Caenorhabditis remanei TaxID=31234 RepID=A0A6A5HD12_CAERE|nr:hypothetical protein GCK72_004210 [Caenorhabditis remanei]KAF1764263.1 hypothetical protein GCK72_004210 [Caenorhabditis remanei]